MSILLELNFKQKNATRLITAIGGFSAYLLIKDSTKLSMALGAIMALMLRNPTIVYVLFVTIPRDVT